MAKIIIIYLALVGFKNCVESAEANQISGLFTTNNLNGISSGDKFECEASLESKSISSSKNNTLEYFTLGVDYSYMKATSKNCFSFKIRGINNVHIAMSSVPKHSPDMLEIIMGYQTNTVMRKRGNMGKHIFTKSTPNIINNEEFRGFWLHFTESGLVEFGREGEITPFVSYQHDSLTIVHYIGITTWQSYASWLIDLEPKCPGIEVRSETETVDLKCSKSASDKENYLKQLIRLQGKILLELNTITKIFNEIESPNSFGIEDFYNDLNELFKESKSIHKKVIFLETDSHDAELLVIEENSIYDQIKENVYENFAQKCLQWEAINLNSKCFKSHK